MQQEGLLKTAENKKQANMKSMSRSSYIISWNCRSRAHIPPFSLMHSRNQCACFRFLHSNMSFGTMQQLNSDRHATGRLSDFFFEQFVHTYMFCMYFLFFKQLFSQKLDWNSWNELQNWEFSLFVTAGSNKKCSKLRLKARSKCILHL